MRQDMEDLRARLAHRHTLAVRHRVAFRFPALSAEDGTRGERLDVGVSREAAATAAVLRAHGTDFEVHWAPGGLVVLEIHLRDGGDPPLLASCYTAQEVSEGSTGVEALIAAAHVAMCRRGG